MKNETKIKGMRIIRIPLRFRTPEEQDLYFVLRKLSNIENKSLNTLIINELKKLKNDFQNRRENT
tara:strand:- start:823 stop:1017 length:195 start_codon:yes stop_codon:yes gene_type:complete